MPEVKQERRKILLVGSYGRMDVEDELVRTGCCVVKTDGRAAAVVCAKHDSFSAAVLVSTGREMDMAETALNLRDIRPSMEIIMSGLHANAIETLPRYGIKITAGWSVASPINVELFSEIILVARDHGKLTQGEVAVKAIPNTRVLTLEELVDYLARSGL